MLNTFNDCDDRCVRKKHGRLCSPESLFFISKIRFSFLIASTIRFFSSTICCFIVWISWRSDFFSSGSEEFSRSCSYFAISFSIVLIGLWSKDDDDDEFIISSMISSLYSIIWLLMSFFVIGVLHKAAALHHVGDRADSSWSSWRGIGAVRSKGPSSLLYGFCGILHTCLVFIRYLVQVPRKAVVL